MNYLDTSVLVAALTEEVHSTRADRLLAEAAETFSISEWVIAEFSSALSAKFRLGTIGRYARRAALDSFGSMVAQSLVLLPITGSHFRAAARFADQDRIGLRAPDALHLAVAADAAAMLCTFDKRLASAGKALGVRTQLV